MKILQLFLMIGIVIPYCLDASQKLANKVKSSQQEWQKFHADSTKDAQFSRPAIAVELPKPASYGTMVHFIYGNNTAKNPYQATADFHNAQKMAEQSRAIGAPLPLGTFYNMTPAQKEVTQKIYEGFTQSTDKKSFAASPEIWREIGSHMPMQVRHSFTDDFTVKREKSLEQKIEHLAAQTAKGTLIIGCGAGIASLAKHSAGNIKAETKQSLWNSKDSIAQEALERTVTVIRRSGIKAIDNGLDYATDQLNKIDFDKAGGHCDYESFFESQKFFTDTTKHAGNTLKDELFWTGIGYGVELVIEHLPAAALKTSNIALDTDDVSDGAMVGAGLGLAYGIYTIDNPIEEVPINQIYSRRV